MAHSPTDSSLAAEFQRGRIIAATIAVASEHRVSGVTVSRVIARARLSRRTFYALFDDRGDCLYATYVQIMDRAAARVLPAYAAESQWVDRVRAGLHAALEFFDEQPQLARLCFVQAPAAGEQTVTCRTRLIGSLAKILNDDCAAEHPSRLLPDLASQAVVGGVLEILHARLVAEEGIELAKLSDQLMAVIVLPYLGSAAARRELARRPRLPAGEPPASRARSTALVRPPTRVTYRTWLTLSTISQSPGLSNREISERVGIKDQGQISKLLSRLCELRLIENVGAGQAHGAANAWRLAPGGMRLIQSAVHHSSSRRLKEKR